MGNLPTKNLFNILLALLMLISIGFVSIGVEKIREPVSRAAPPPVTVPADNSDGYIGYIKNSYPPDSSGYRSCGASSSGSLFLFNGHVDSTTYQDYRSYLAFNTANKIPSNATITSAYINLTLGGINKEVNFDIRVRNYNWGGSLSCSAWGSSLGGSPTAALVGTKNTAGLPGAGGSFNIDITNLGSINRSGTTYFMVADSREEDNNRPSWSESVSFYSAESGATAPKLVINYTIPQPPNPPNPPTPTSPPKPKTPGSTGNKSTTQAKAPGPFEILQLEVSVPYLAGSLKVKVEVGGVTKEIEVSSDVKTYTVDLRGANLSTNKEYPFVATSNKTLVRKINFTLTAAATNINIGELILGDINQDNVIDSKDQLLLVDAITKQDSKGDLNGDKAANSFDWAILLTNFGRKGDN